MTPFCKKQEFYRQISIKTIIVLFLLMNSFCFTSSSKNSSKKNLFGTNQWQIMTSSEKQRQKRQTSSLTSAFNLSSTYVTETLISGRNVNETSYTCPEACQCPLGNFKVQCSFRHLTVVPRDLPNDVQSLDLSRNKLSKITADAFGRFHLTELFLEKNNIKTIEKIFTNLPTLAILRLSWNSIGSVRKLTLKDLVSLKKLYLDNNRLIFLHPEAFRGLIKLSYLDLSHNKLSHLHSDTFVTVQFADYFRFSHIQTLDLSNNKLTILSEKMIFAFNNLREFYFYGNDLECSCLTFWFIQWWKENFSYRCKKSSLQRTDLSQCPVCSSPNHLKNQLITDISRTNVTCSQPRIVGQEPISISELFLEHPGSTEVENDEYIFQYSNIQYPSFAIRFLNNNQTIAVLNCNATGRPETNVILQNSIYVGNMLVNMDCTIQHPVDEEKIRLIFEPYLKSRLILQRHSIITTKTNKQHQNKIIYFVKRDEKTSTSKTSTNDNFIYTAELKSHFDCFKTSNATITLIGNHFHPMERIMGVSYRNTVEYHLKKNSHVRGLPWTLAGEPSSEKTSSKVAMEGKFVVLRCKAMGYPKPNLYWILPSGRLLRPMSRFARYRVNRGGKLIVFAVSKIDEGVYRCMSQSIQRRLSETNVAAAVGSLHLYVITSTVPLFPNLVRHIDVSEGEDWTHSCVSEATPQSKITWTYPNQKMLRYRKQNQNNVAISSDGTISIKNITKLHEGFYRCIAVNVIGASEFTVYVEVLLKRQNKTTPYQVSSPIQEEIATQKSILNAFKNPISTKVIKQNNTESPFTFSENLMTLIPNSTVPERKLKATTVSFNTRQQLIEATTVPKEFTASQDNGVSFTSSNNAIETVENIATTPSAFPTARHYNEISTSTKFNSFQKELFRTKHDTIYQSTSSLNLLEERQSVRSSGFNSTTAPSSFTNNSASSINTTFELNGSITSKVFLTFSDSTDKNFTGLRNPLLSNTDTSHVLAFENKTKGNKIKNESSAVKTICQHNSCNGDPLPVIFKTKKNLLCCIQNGKVHCCVTFNQLHAVSKTKPSNSSSQSAKKELDLESSQEANEIENIDYRQNFTVINNNPQSTSEKVQISSKETKDSFTRNPVKENFFEPIFEPTAAYINPTSGSNSFVKERNESFPATNRTGSSEAFNRRQVKDLIRVTYGDMVTIQCRVSNAPPIHWKFYFRKKSTGRRFGIVMDLREIENVSFLNATTITLSRATSSHNGTFQCRNSLLETYRAHVILRTSPPTITQPISSEITVNYGKSLTIPCLAEGNPQPKISWSWSISKNLSAETTSNSSKLKTIVYTKPESTLHIQKATPIYGITYVCTAESIAGEATHSVDVRVVSLPPTIRKTEFEKFVNEGEKVRIDCATQAIPEARIKWILPSGSAVVRIFDNFANENVLSNGSLLIVSAKKQHEGTFTCIATNPLGKDSIEMRLNILLYPGSNVRREIISSTFADKRPSTSPTTKTTTVISRIPTTVTTAISATTSTTATTTTTLTAATSTTATTPTTATTSTTAATSTTSVAISISSIYSRQFRLKAYVKHGDTAFLHCRTKTSSNRFRARQRRRGFINRVKARWKTPSGRTAAFPYPVPSWRHRVFVNGTLRIVHTRTSDSGVYSCIVEESSGRKVRTQTGLVVSSQSPTIHQTLHEVITISRDRAVWAPCSASGYPKPVITWKTPQGRKFSTGSYGAGLRVFTNGKLMLYAATNDNTGTYTCTASNSAGSMTRVVTFQLRTFAPIIRGVSSTMQHVRIGESTRLSCPAVGVPEPDVHWTMPGGKTIRKNQGVFEKGFRGSKASMLSSGTLVIQRATIEDNGFYHCIASNYKGSDTKTVNLKVYF